MENFDFEFRPEYPGDNPNRAWIRKTAEAKGFTADPRKILLRLPKRSIDILFLNLMRREFPEHV